MTEKEICNVVLEQSSSSTAIKSNVRTKAVAVHAVKSKVNADSNDQEVSDGFSTEGSIRKRILLVRRKNLGPTAGATAVPWYPAILFPGALLLVSWFHLASWLLVFFAFCLWCCSESEDSVNNSRIQHSNCLWFMFDFLSLFT